jgi:hypothetical protein
LRTTRFGNGADSEKVRKITVTIEAGRDGGTKKDKEENGTLDDLQQNEDERRRIQPGPLLKTNSKAPERSSS